MKSTLKLLSAVILLAAAFGCKTSVVGPTPSLSALNFVNATIGSAPLAVKLNNQSIVYSNFSSNEITYGSAHIYAPTGTTTIMLVQATDTLNHLFQGSFAFQAGGIYSLFIAGTVGQLDTVFIHEHLPVYATSDSLAGIRFINLSPGSNPVSVDIKGNPNGSEVASLAYKSYTTFKSYVANHTVSSYTFEFRDAVSGTLLTSYTLSGVNNDTGTNTATNTVRFHNMTLALIGQPAGGTVAQKIILVPNY